MTIRVPEPPEKYGFLHPASVFAFMTPDGNWWQSVEHWMEHNAPPAGKATDTFLNDAVVNVLRLKFAFNHDIRKKLVETGKKEIRSGKRGRNHWLGNALMEIRKEFRSGDWAMNVPWTPFANASFEEGGQEDTVLRMAHGEGYVGVFMSSRYQVVMAEEEIEGFKGPVTHLSIKRWDKKPIRDWREMQRIKNTLCGPDREACELYPAESRLVDTANQYHLWVLPPNIRFPFGFQERLVVTDTGGALAPDAVQRPFEEAPEDGLTAAELDDRVLGS